MVDQIVVVGCGAAGATAAFQARKLNRKVAITIFNTEPYSQYSRCGLPYTISGKVENFEDLVLTPPENWRGLNIEAKLSTTVTDVDASSRSIAFSDSEESGTMEYDAMVIATGARNADPPIKDLDKERVYRLRTLDDAKVLAEEVGKSKKAVVVGGGLIGMETAEAFHEKGIDVTVVEFLPNILLAMIDPDIAKLVEEHCEDHGLKVVTNTAAQEVLGDSTPKAVRVQNRENNEITDIPADFVVVATGVKPEVNLAEKVGAEIGEFGGIMTDSRMMTNVSDVYACGDCAENPEFITRKPFVSGLGTIAVRQGRVAGMNAAGGDVAFPGIVGAKVTKLFGLEIASTGFTGSMAEIYGIEVAKGSIKGSSKPPYYVGGKDLKVKTYYDKATGKLVGGQIIGLEDAAMRINVITLGIQHDIDVVDLFDFENCYAPAICDTWDPIVTSADAARRRLKR
jgi:NADH oxidase (H2O2-forming)